MQKKIFDYILAQGDIGSLLADGAADLTPSQLQQVKQVASQQSEDKLMSMRMAAATQPGYKESMLMPALMGVFKSMGGGQSEQTAAPTPPSVSNVTKNTSGGLLNNLSSKLNFAKAKGVDSKTTDAQLLGMIYELLVKKQDLEKTEYQEYVERDEQRQSKVEQRHQDIVSALTGFKSKDIPDLEKPKSKKPKKEKMPKAPKTASRVGKKSGIFGKPSGSSGLFKRSGGSSGIFSGGTATRAAVGAAVGVGLAGVATSIGAVEGHGNYNTTFGDDLVGGKLVNRKGFISTQEAFGKPLTEMTLEEVKKFGEMRNAKSKNSGAVGKYQFIPSTLFGRMTKKGFVPGIVQEMKLDMSQKFDAQLQEKLYNYLHGKDLAALKAAGVPITPGYEYMAHYIGAGGAAAVYNNRDKNMTVAEALVAAGYDEPGRKNNPELYKIKTYEFEKLLENRLNSKKTSTATTPSDQGEKINKDSHQNKHLKEESAVTQSINTNNTTNINTGNGEKVSRTSSPEDDTNPYERKMKHG